VTVGGDRWPLMAVRGASRGTPPVSLSSLGYEPNDASLRRLACSRACCLARAVALPRSVRSASRPRVFRSVPVRLVHKFVHTVGAVSGHLFGRAPCGLPQVLWDGKGLPSGPIEASPCRPVRQPDLAAVTAFATLDSRPGLAGPHVSSRRAMYSSSGPSDMAARRSSTLSGSRSHHGTYPSSPPDDLYAVLSCAWPKTEARTQRPGGAWIAICSPPGAFREFA
jgi:hypothetical protein